MFPRQSIVINELTTFLANIDTIRVVVFSGRGFGSQVANIVLINRLRELGFSGLIEVVYSLNSPSGERLAMLIPSFNHLSHEPQIVANNVIVKPLPEYNEHGHYEALDFVPIAITAARDCSWSQDFSQHTIDKHMQDNRESGKGPLSKEMIRWNINNERAKKSRLSHPACYQAGLFIALRHTYFEGNRFSAILGETNPIYNIPENGVLYCKKNTVSANPARDLREIEFLQLIQQRTQDKIFQLQLVYGIYNPEDANGMNAHPIHPRTQLTRLFKAIMRADFAQPVIVLCVSQVELEALQFDEMLEKRIVRSNDFEDLIEIMNSKSDRRNITKIIFFNVRELNKEFFDELLMLSTLPPVVEGGNSLSFLEPRRFFLRGGAVEPRLQRVPDRFLDAYGSSDTTQDSFYKANTCLEAESLLNEEEHINALKNWLLKTMQNNPEVVQYYAARKAYYLNRPDLIATALYRASKLDFPRTKEQHIARVSEPLNAIAINGYTPDLFSFFQETISQLILLCHPNKPILNLSVKTRLLADAEKYSRNYTALLGKTFFLCYEDQLSFCESAEDLLDKDATNQSSKKMLRGSGRSTADLIAEKQKDIISVYELSERASEPQEDNNKHMTHTEQTVKPSKNTVASESRSKAESDEQKKASCVLSIEQLNAFLMTYQKERTTTFYSMFGLKNVGSATVANLFDLYKEANKNSLTTIDANMLTSAIVDTNSKEGSGTAKLINRLRPYLSNSIEREVKSTL